MTLEKALAFAQHSHEGQHYKGTDRPFLYHPLAVAALVLKYGGSNEQAQAALLHDTIADGKITLEDLKNQFGARVAHLTFAFSDPEIPPEKAATWRGSKEAYLVKVAQLSEEELLLIACEELHELGELVLSAKQEGITVWKRYPVHGMEVFWYYRELLKIFNQQLTSKPLKPLTSEFASKLKTLSDFVFEGAAP